MAHGLGCVCVCVVCVCAHVQVRGKGGAVSKLMESMAADEDFEPNQDSSFSEDENPRLSTERPCTPGEHTHTHMRLKPLFTD